AGTAGVQMCMGLVKSKTINAGLPVGADRSQGRAGYALEYTASAGACALVIGNYNFVASIDHTESFTTDTPDFWRREGATYPSHGGRFTGEPAYFKHVTRAAENIMYNTNTTPDDYDYVVFHEPNSKFPLTTAKKLGFSKEKVEPSLAVRWIGNTYSASSMIGLAATLDIAKAGDKILMISYGSGSGSDAFTITVRDGIEERRKNIPKVQDYIDDKVFLDYSYYTKHRGKIKM
ncbi:MAG: hydroxymethylglutaryl-CoA synthase, partial [Candidatus Heimdallarchaeota archaeon]|nr:hydroxymethylglutaryl-CoA synthase [Candidatus Heimdallarchaeota archaeon]